MNRLGLLTSVGVGALLAASSLAVAQDGFDWSGPYAGLTIGAGAIGTDTSFEGSDWYDYQQGALQGAATAGFNWQNGTLVYGVEGDIGLMATGDAESDVMADPSLVSATVSPLATLRGRVGVATGNLLIYGTAGVAIGNVEIDDNDTADASASGVAVAPVLGAGIEIAVNDSLSLKAEGRFASFAIDGADTYTSDVNTAVGLVGVNFHF